MLPRTWPPKALGHCPGATPSPTSFTVEGGLEYRLFNKSVFAEAELRKKIKITSSSYIRHLQKSFPKFREDF